MDNVWERLAQLQVRHIGDIAHRRSFHKYSNRAASEVDFVDSPREDARRGRERECASGRTKNLRWPQPSVLDAEDERGPQVALDALIWRNLPESLVETILPHLPLHSLLRFRAVCRRWNSILHSPTFLQSWHCGEFAQRAPESPWLIFRGSARECVAYNPRLDRWINIPLGFLPSPRVRVVATAGGLLCVRRRDDSLMVCNPFTKTFVHLTPKPWKWKYPIVGMVADSPGSYRVIVAGSHGVPAPDLTTEVYDSVSKKWKLIRSRPSRHQFQTNAVYCNGFLYSAGFSVIMSYDVKREIWSEMRGPPVTQHTNLIMPQICECRGRLLMVEVVSERFVMRRVSIWEIEQSGSGEWLKLDTMPDALLGEVIAMSNSRLFTYFGHDDLLCFVIARREILSYSVSNRAWRWLRTCPFVQGFAQRFAAFAFHPSLDACV